MKRLLSVLLTLPLMLCGFCAPAKAHGVNTSARAYALYCADNGAVLLSDNLRKRLPMASTTKIMTALITLEHAAKRNRTVTFTKEMTAEGSSMCLLPGERLTLYDLAVGMLMQSGNDAANAAAVAIGGSVEKFADIMNTRAAELGMKDTVFVTPSGLDDEEHLTTAYDMALLMAAAMENRDFRDITGRTSMKVSFTEPRDKTVTYPNHNKLLRLYDGCIGGKTGYTDSAGRCLVSCARRNGLTLIAVTLDDPDDWDDHAALYDYGFERYRAVKPKKLSFTVDVVGGDRDRIKVESRTDKVIVADKKELGGIKRKALIQPFLYAPLSSKKAVGAVEYYLKKKKLLTVPLYPVTDG